MPVVDALGEFLLDLPAPFGMIVTGLLPIVAFVGFIGAVWASSRRRGVLATGLAVVCVLGLVGILAFVRAAGGH